MDQSNCGLASSRLLPLPMYYVASIDRRTEWHCLSRSYLDVVVLAIAWRNRLFKQKAFEIGQHFEGQFGFEITVKVR